MDSQLYLFIGFISFVISALLIVAIFNTATNTKKTKIYAYMQVKILEKLAEKEEIKIDMKELLKEAKYMS